MTDMGFFVIFGSFTVFGIVLEIVKYDFRR